MTNAPPTPPPTSPRELQDEARSNVMDIAGAAQQLHSQPRPELYATVIPTLKAAISNHDHQHVLNVAEHFVLNTTVDRSVARLLIVAPLVLEYLIKDDLQPARFVLSKLPEPLQALPVTRHLSDLLLSTVNREHAKVYNKSAELASIVSAPDFPDRDLAELITGLLPDFINAFRDRTFQLLSKAYTTLSLPLVSIYLGFPEEQLISVAQCNGWSYNPTSQTFQPKVAHDRSTRQSNSGSSNLTTFEIVADSVAQLEA
ncbi:hypothetical protein CVT24_003405 [Panaeolus cyanescens]|uniref:CSN8/PSMD8/EIF3K domain-containing protein n=1 Tax=Panaeolus cyanescens TaxID=181874 RepID=A0A409Y7D0_9AGAR|nr:hypothetical protein CVT24_003405 [Panaeolus cyanescens]